MGVCVWFSREVSRHNQSERRKVKGKGEGKGHIEGGGGKRFLMTTTKIPLKTVLKVRERKDRGSRLI